MDRKGRLILIQVTEQEKEALKARAEEYHLNLSRFLILMGLKGRVQ